MSSAHGSSYSISKQSSPLTNHPLHDRIGAWLGLLFIRWNNKRSCPPAIKLSHCRFFYSMSKKNILFYNNIGWLICGYTPPSTYSTNLTHAHTNTRSHAHMHTYTRTIWTKFLFGFNIAAIKSVCVMMRLRSSLSPSACCYCLCSKSYTGTCDEPQSGVTAQVVSASIS